jgi:hypothetical protein
MYESISHSTNEEDSDLPHSVWRKFAGRPIQLSVRLLHSSGEEIEDPTVLIEGNADTLEWLSKVIAAVAVDEDCGYGVSPVGAGNAFFDRRATHGIYIHRLPCVNEEIQGRADEGKR